MSEQILDALSTTNEDGAPHLGTCTMVIGDGTMKVEFRNGRAKVPASWAHMLALHPHVEIPALAFVDEPVEEVEEGVEEKLDYDPLPVPALKALAAQRGLKVTGKVTKAKLIVALEQADEEPPSRPDTAPVVTDAALELARQHLLEEGLEVPDVEVADSDSPPARPGLEATTVDGQARCQAATAAGGQCSNPAVDGSQACRLDKHQGQLAE